MSLKEILKREETGPLLDANDFLMKRVDVGTKLWMRLNIPGQDTGTASLFLGIHEYDF